MLRSIRQHEPTQPERVCPARNDRERPPANRRAASRDQANPGRARRVETWRSNGYQRRAPADVNDRLTKLESEVNALQVALPVPLPAPSPAAGAVTPGTPAPAASSPPTPPPSTTAAAVPPPPSAGAAVRCCAEPAQRERGTRTDLAAGPRQGDRRRTKLEGAGREDLSQGARCHEGGSYPTAIVDFAKVQHGYPKSPLSEAAQYFTANAFYENGKYEQAILAVQRPDDALSQQPLSLRESAARGAIIRTAQRPYRRAPHAAEAGRQCQLFAEAAAANNLLKNLGSD